MSSKPKQKNRLIWWLLPSFCVLALSVIVVPPMVHLNSMKPKLENIIFKQTGINAKIHGNVNFSLIGTPTLVVHNISVPNGVISSCEFKIPFRDIFNIKNANIAGDIAVNNASLNIEKIVPFDIDTNINIYNSKINFLNKEYDIISANLSKATVEAIVRTDQHKYEIKSFDNNFIIRNKNNDLDLSGQLLPDGTATAHISIVAQNINRWFEFQKPRIEGLFPITADVKWNGSYGLDFYNISANGVHGEVILKEDGYKIIKLNSKSADFDMSFILQNPDILNSASFDMDFYGKIKFVNNYFKHLYINTVGFDDKIEIKDIIADDLKIHGGFIDKNGAHNLQLEIIENNIKTTCLFNGTPNDWSCDEFSYNNKMTGNIKVNSKTFNANIYSKENIKDINSIINASKRFGDKGVIKFDFANMAGIITISGKKVSVKYDFVHDKNLAWLNINLPFLPDFMLTENGNFEWQDDTMSFIPDSKKWYITTTKDYFYISGDNFKKWLPNLDLQSIRDLSYIVYGNYKNGNISNLNLEIGNHKFIGSVSGKSITLKTKNLDLDFLLSPTFIDNFEELSFFAQMPIMIPFGLDVKLALTADSLTYRNKTYKNFLYSLKRDNQTFSITDSHLGNILATIIKTNTNYDINIQTNKFVISEPLLEANSPLNISDSIVTAEINLKTSGKIAHDIINNLKGSFDASFEGGILYGLGFTKFYESAQNMTTMNAEQILAKALEGGTTTLKKLHIIGTYNNGDIKTSTPLILSMPHIDASGQLEIIKNKMFAKLNLILRGTSPAPSPIELIIKSNQKREYSSLYEIIDPEYMRIFTQNHNKF